MGLALNGHARLVRAHVPDEITDLLPHPGQPRLGRVEQVVEHAEVEADRAAGGVEISLG